MRQEIMEAADLIIANQKIQAIKVVRAITNLGLKEAKDIVDNVTNAGTLATGRDGVAYALAQKLKPLLPPLEESKAVSAFPYSAHRSISAEYIVSAVDVLVMLLHEQAETQKAVLKAQQETNELLKDLLEAMSE